MPSGDIVVDVGHFNLGMVILDGHPDDTILLVGGVTHFVLQGLSPVATEVTVAAIEAVSAPWVSHLDKSVSIGELLNAKSDIGVALDKTITVVRCIVIARGSSLEDVVLAVVLSQMVPKLIHTDIAVPVAFEGTTMKGSGRNIGVSTNNVLVVSMELGKCLLEDSAPERAVLTNVRENCPPVAFAALEWEPVVDDDGVG